MAKLAVGCGEGRNGGGAARAGDRDIRNGRCRERRGRNGRVRSGRVRFRAALLRLLAAGAAFAAALLPAALSGCAPEAALQGCLGGDCAPPSFLGVRAVARDRLEFSFSEPVTLSGLRLAPEAGEGALSYEGSTATALLPRPLAEGASYAADFVASDADGNTLSVFVPFRGRNEHAPRLLLNEVRTEYSKPKAEFVELLALSGGNLGGLSLAGSAGGASRPMFSFPALNVAAGDYVVIHLRSLEAGCVDETGEAGSGRNVATATDSSSAWDFWLAGSAETLRKSDAVALLDGDGKPLDALVFQEDASGPWKSPELAAFAAFLAEAGVWPAAGKLPLPSDAVSSAGATPTRTLCRKSGAPAAGTGAWFLASSGGSSPGAANAEAALAASVPAPASKRASKKAPEPKTAAAPAIPAASAGDTSALAASAPDGTDTIAPAKKASRKAKKTTAPRAEASGAPQAADAAVSETKTQAKKPRASSRKKKPAEAEAPTPGP